MTDNQPYIGAPVTLISSLDVRYEGTLFTIDPNESTVALKNVRCLGTEGRQQGQKAIPPSDAVYEFIIFRGENIKNINIAEEKFNNKNELSDPSILKLGPKGSSVEPKRDQRRSTRGDGGNMPPYFERQYRRGDPAKYRPRRQDPRQGGYGGGYRRDQRRNYPPRGYDQYERRGNDRRYDNRRLRNRRNQNQRDRRGPDNQRSQAPRANPGDAKFLTGRDAKEDKISMSEEFDFEKATFDKKNVLEEKKVDGETNATEQKEEAEAGASEKTEEQEKGTTPEVTETAETGDNKPSETEPKSTEDQEEQKEESPEPADPAPKPFEYTYKPENFFDDLDLADRSTMDFKARRKIDAQTFGEEASNYKVRRRRRRGGSNRRRRPRYNNRY